MFLIFKWFKTAYFKLTEQIPVTNIRKNVLSTFLAAFLLDFQNSLNKSILDLQILQVILSWIFRIQYFLRFLPPDFKKSSVLYTCINTSL